MTVDTPDPTFLERLWSLAPAFTENTPHAQKLGIKFISVDKGQATMSLPYHTQLIGNPKSRVIHGGAVTTLLDQASGLAAISGFDTLRMTATLSLNINYMRAATPGQTVIAKAYCYKATQHVAFIRGIAHDGDEDDPLATSQATFMATSLPDKASLTMALKTAGA